MFDANVDDVPNSSVEAFCLSGVRKIVPDEGAYESKVEIAVVAR